MTSAQSSARDLIARARLIVDRARFTFWTTRLRLRLLGSGARLELDMKSPPRLGRTPRTRISLAGSGERVVRISIGRGVQLDDVLFEIWARGTNVLEIGDHSILEGCMVQLRSGSIVLGDHVQIRDHVAVKSSGDLRIGARAVIGFGSSLHCQESLRIEPLTGVAERVTIIDSGKQMIDSDDYFYDRPTPAEPVVVGRNSFIGTGAVLLAGVRLGENSAVSANSVVRGGTYERSTFLAGAPAREIKRLEAAGS